MANQNLTSTGAIVPMRNELAYRTTSIAPWSAVVAGGFVTAALWLVLHLFGMGVGLTTIEPDAPGTLAGLGVGVGVWSSIAPVIALFAGGAIASRFAPTPNRVNRMIHGALVWALASLVALAAMYAVGAAPVGGQVAGGQVADGERATLAGLGIAAGDLLGPINQRLQADGEPAVTATAVETAALEVLATSVDAGQLDRAALAQALARDTALTRGDAEDVATSIEARWRAVTRRAADHAARTRRAALHAATSTGQAMMWLALALLAGLGASLGGALLTGRHDRRRVDVDRGGRGFRATPAR